MRVAIRVDASIRIGTGHVMRCLTLADRLRESGAEVVFICRQLAGNMIAQVKAAGFAVVALPPPTGFYVSSAAEPTHADWLEVDWETDADQTVNALTPQVDWLIVDHYALDHRWQRRVRAHANGIMVIDDLADRKHECDLLLDQNAYEDAAARYDGLVSPGCMTLLGPSYALLRSEFEAARRRLARSFDTVSTLLISMGGVDAVNSTQLAVEGALLCVETPLEVDVVFGEGNPHLEELRARYARRESIRFHRQVANMAVLFSKADLAIGGSGATTWERCCLGLPTIALAIADHQRLIGENAEKAGLVQYLGSASQISPAQVKDALTCLVRSREKREEMGRAGMALVDGKGTNRVVDHLEKPAAVRL
jgi:UDP-2,4-diacetamido-2,4,6-trideoxy-beta-L-altropyranose hydrolase